MKYQSRIDPERLVFIDETWTKTNMAPLRGWAPRGQRLTAKVPHGHWKTMTFLAALRHDRIDAPWLLDGPINAESFRAYVENVLVPTLDPGDIVIMDNLGSHKGEAIRQAIRCADAKLFFLPKYSPDPERMRSAHRTGLRQAQASVAQGRRANHRSRLRRDRPDSRRRHTTGVRKLLQKRGI